MKVDRCCRLARAGLVSFRMVLLVLPAAAQDPVTIDQVRITGAPVQSRSIPQVRIQESEYILGGPAVAVLMSPSAPVLQSPSSSQARAIQTGVGNVGTIDMSGSGNTAVQTVFGSRNTVSQSQSGNQNSSTVTVFGNTNTVGTQQDANAATATVTVLGNSNNVTAQQQGNFPLPISITQVGNGGNVSVSRK